MGKDSFQMIMGYIGSEIMRPEQTRPEHRKEERRSLRFLEEQSNKETKTRSSEQRLEVIIMPRLVSIYLNVLNENVDEFK